MLGFRAPLTHLSRTSRTRISGQLLLKSATQYALPGSQLAVTSDLKAFCANRFCQYTCEQYLNGVDDAGINQWVLHPRFSGRTLQDTCLLYFHILCPLPIPSATFWIHPNSKTALTSKAAWHECTSCVAGSPPYLGIPGFYGAPLVKQLVRLLTYVVFVLMYSYTVMESRIFPDLNFADGAIELPLGVRLHGFEPVLLTWTFGLVLDEWYQWAVAPASFDLDFAHRYDYLTIFSTRLVGSEPPSEGQTSGA